MDFVEHAQTLARYNRWMNERIYVSCDTLSDEQRKRDTGAFFRSIHGTLNHILLGDRVWLGRFIGVPFTVRSLDQELYADFAEQRAEREKTDATIIDWTASLSPAAFEQTFSYTSTKGQSRTYAFWLAVTHYFNHQTHHRGQVTTLLIQQGVDPGVTDMIWLPGVQVAG